MYRVRIFYRNQLLCLLTCSQLSPFTYLIEGLLGQAVGRQQITCAAQELVPVNPPDGQTCVQYLQAYIDTAGVYSYFRICMM